MGWAQFVSQSRENMDEFVTFLRAMSGVVAFYYVCDESIIKKFVFNFTLSSLSNHFQNKNKFILFYFN